MRRIAEFRGKLHGSTQGNQDRGGRSVRRKMWWIAGTVLTVGVLAAPGPALRFGSAPNFGSPPVGSRSAEHFVSLRNSGLAPLTIKEIRIADGEAGDFLAGTTNCTNGAVLPGKDCVFGVFFAPKGAGRRSTDVVVMSEDLVAPPHLVLTAIAATRTDFSVEPATISFGNQRVGTASSEKLARISSSPNVAVRIREVHITKNANGDFELGGNTCGDSLPKGGICTIGVSFHPRMAGERTGQLELLDDSGDAAHEIVLSGSGTVGELSLEPEQISFPVTKRGQRSEPESVQIRNIGNEDVHLGAVAIEGAAAGDFAIVDKRPCESVTLRAGWICELRVQFEPRVTGSQSANISLGDDAPDGPHKILLVGTGTEEAKPSAQIYAKSYSFGPVALRTTSKPVQVWVVSRGKTPLAIGTVDFQGGRPKNFGLRTDCSQRNLKTNDQCEIDVYFSPFAAGDARARILVPHDAPDAPTYFDVDGMGIGVEGGWCCLEGKVFETDENTCRIRGGRLYADASTAQSQCARPPVPAPTAQAEAPTGLEPGTPSRTGTRAIACESLTFHWNPAPAPGGYLVSLARLQPGSDTNPPVVFSQNVATNSYKLPSALEAGSYEWSVISLGERGQRNAPAPPNYFLCAARVNVAGRPMIATLPNIKAKSSAVISPPIQ